MYLFSWLLLPTLISSTTILSTIYPYKSIKVHIGPCRKIGQGQPRVIIWIIYVLFGYPMLLINFQSHRPFGFREEDIEVFYIYGMTARLVMWPFEHTFVLPFYGGFTWNLATIGLAVSKEKKSENVETERPWTKFNEKPRPLIFIKVRVLI